MFHLLIVNAVYIVAECKVLSNSEELSNAKTYMRSWVKKGLNGSETFTDVCLIFHPEISCIEDYVNYITKIPLIPSFFAVKYQQNKDVLMVSLIMSLECFETYVSSLTAYDEFMGTKHHESNLLQSNNTPTMFTEAIDEEEVPYDNPIEDYHVINNTIVDRELVEKMYRNAFNVAENGNQGKGLPPPMSRRVKQKKKKDSYFLCEFQDAEDKTYFRKWLSFVDTIEVIRH
jgi:hypothetical protein